MRPPPPHLSVCVPAYNAEQHLPATLASVLASDHPSFEVVVLDNASTDRTGQIVGETADARVRLERNETVLSLPDNWNRVVAHARGTLVKIVCADDLIRPDALRRQAAVLDGDPGVALVGARRHLIDGTGALLVPDTGLRHLVGRFGPAEVVSRVIRDGGNPVGESAAVMFRREDFEACGGFDPQLLFPMDLELWVRLLAHGDFVGLRETLAAFRASTGSLSAERSSRQYDEQRELTRRIVRDARWPVRRHDRALSLVGAPLAKLRRELLFTLAAHPRLSAVSRRIAPGAEIAWLEDGSAQDSWARPRH